MAIEDGASWFCSYGLLLHELIMCVCVCVCMCVCVCVCACVCVKVPSSGTQLKLCVPEHTIILKDPGLNSGLATPWQGHPAPKTSWHPAGDSAPGHHVLSAFTSASISSVSSPGLLERVVSAATSCPPSWPLHSALCLVLCACGGLASSCSGSPQGPGVSCSGFLQWTLLGAPRGSQVQQFLEARGFPWRLEGRFPAIPTNEAS